MNVLEKIGMLYSFYDCAHRNCDNCISKEFCIHNRSVKKKDLINEISAEVRTIIKERDEAIAKLKETTNDQEK